MGRAKSPLYNKCKSFMSEMMGRRKNGPFDYVGWIVQLMGGWNRQRIPTLNEILAMINPNSEGVEGGWDGPNQKNGAEPWKVFPNIRKEYENAGNGAPPSPPVTKCSCALNLFELHGGTWCDHECSVRLCILY